MRTLVFFIALITGFPVSTSQSASISLGDLGPNNPGAVFVVGDLVERDAAEFRNVVGPLSKAVVFFRSDGGSLIAGIDIGETIRLKKVVKLPALFHFATSHRGLAPRPA